MARKSVSHFEVVPIEQLVPVIEPPKRLSQSEAELFRSIVQQASRDHFTKNDAEMLAAYVQSCALVDLAYCSALASPKMLQDWERACRVMVNLARQLRLTPRSRIDPKSLTRELTGRSFRHAGVTLEDLSEAREGGGGRDWKARG